MPIPVLERPLQQTCKCHKNFRAIFKEKVHVEPLYSKDHLRRKAGLPYWHSFIMAGCVMSALYAAVKKEGALYSSPRCKPLQDQNKRHIFLIFKKHETWCSQVWHSFLCTQSYTRLTHNIVAPLRWSLLLVLAKKKQIRCCKTLLPKAIKATRIAANVMSV